MSLSERTPPALRLRPWVAQAWTAALVAGLVLIVGFRLVSGWPKGPTPATASRTPSSGHRSAEAPPAPKPSDERGVLTAETVHPSMDSPETLADLARRVRILQDAVNETRAGLAETQSRAATQRERMAVLEAMVANDTLTHCPPFLQEETTVRALQGILREAAASEASGNGSRQDPPRAAVLIARQRLQRTLLAIRDRLDQEAVELEQKAQDLRCRLRQQTQELETLQRQVLDRLEDLHDHDSEQAPPS